MQAAKTDQTGQMPSQIRVFAGCTCDFVDFVIYDSYVVLQSWKMEKNQGFGDPKSS